MGILPVEKRQYFRHPINVPIQLQAQREPTRSSEVVDISLGGLSFAWHKKLPRGSSVNITIPVKDKLFEVKARVVYSREIKVDTGYRIGVSFIDVPSAFKARLAEEALQILEYRKKISRELGYELSEEEAAKKWVIEYAAIFPSMSGPEASGEISGVKS